MEKQTDKGYRIEYVPLTEVQRWDRNPKLHDEKGIDESLARFGFTEPLLLDEKSGKLVAGHGRLEALQRWQKAGKPPPTRVATKGGEWLVPVVRGITFKDDREAEAYLVASNRLVEIGGWDEAGLSAILKDLSTSSSLEGTGYKPTDLESMLREVSAASAPVVGATPAELEEKFLAANIKQIVLYFEGDAYDATVARLDAARKQLGVESNTEVFNKLLDVFEAQLPSEPAPDEPAAG